MRKLGVEFDARTPVDRRRTRTPEPTIIMPVEAGQIGRHGAYFAGIALIGLRIAPMLLDESR